MAYRAPERRERPHDAHAAPSYLDDFLDLIDPLQASTKATFAEIKSLDDRITNTLSLADAAVDDTVARANSSAAIASVRRQYQEFIHQQMTVQELSDNKLALATAALSGLDSVLAELDDKLRDFEAQLRREGRWPGAVPPNQQQPPQPPQSQPPPPPTSASRSAVHPLAARNAHKIPRRQPPPQQSPSPHSPSPSPPPSPSSSPPPPTRTPSHPLLQRQPPPPPPPPPPAPPSAASNAVSTAAPPAPRGKPVVNTEELRRDVVMTDRPARKDAHAASDMVTDTTLDNTLYCICRQVSSGNMVACEDDDCVYEWFHFECVNLTEEPVGIWYCPDCTEKRRKAGRRKL